ncbi:MAG: hypothetical protein JNL82_40305 [Myxococcales bacterium]|nr:hypothetical protein [Myxococcales bacterium]
MFGGDARDECWADAALRRHADRHARRAALGEDEDMEDRDWLTLDNGNRMLRIREGSLIVRPHEDVRRGYWSLYMQWDGHDGARLLASGPRHVLERLAKRIQQEGPPGGPDFIGPGPRWRADDDGTEHAVTVGGELRLMPPVVDDGDGVLLRAHNDRGGSVTVLGVGEHDQLQNDADELDGHTRARLRVSIGGRDRYLQALGADGIVGFLDLGEDLFVLAHLGGDEFGLASESGDIRRAIRTYSLEEVLRGDLGRVDGWADSRVAGDPPPRATRQAASGQRARQDTKRSGGKKKRPAPQTPPHLSGVDLIKALLHLTPLSDCIGNGSTVIPKLLNAFRALIQLADLGNLIFWAKKLLDFIREKTGQEIHCCLKILNIALRRIALHTKLLVRRGRRWELRLGELRALGSALLQEMIEAGPIDLDRKPGSKQGKKQARPQTAAAPGTDSAPAAEVTPPSTVSPAHTPPQASSTPPASPTADDSPPSQPTNVTSPLPTSDGAPSSPPADGAAAPTAVTSSAAVDGAPSSKPADEAAPTAVDGTPSSKPADGAAAPTAPRSSPPADGVSSSKPADEAVARPAVSDDPTPSAAPSDPPCDTDVIFVYLACDSDSPPTASVDMAAPTVLALGAPVSKMSAPPPARRPQRAELDPVLLASLGLPAATPYQQLATVYLAEMKKRSQQSIGLHPGNHAAQPRDEARTSLPARAAGGLTGSELRSPGGWIRRGAGRRSDRPP